MIEIIYHNSPSGFDSGRPFSSDNKSYFALKGLNGNIGSYSTIGSSSGKTLFEFTKSQQALGSQTFSVLNGEYYSDGEDLEFDSSVSLGRTIFSLRENTGLGTFNTGGGLTGFTPALNHRVYLNGQRLNTGSEMMTGVSSGIEFELPDSPSSGDFSFAYTGHYVGSFLQEHSQVYLNGIQLHKNLDYIETSTGVINLINTGYRATFPVETNYKETFLL